MDTLRKYLLWGIVCLCGQLSSQTVNEFHYQLGESGRYWDAVLLPGNEQLVCLGSIWDDEFSRYVITVDTIDTNGNMIGSTILADTAGRGYQFIRGADRQLALFPNNSVYVSISIAQSGGNCIYHLEDGQIKSYWEYPLPANQLSSKPVKLMPAGDNGLFQFCHIQLAAAPYDTQIQVNRIDSTGQKLWTRYYGSLSNRDYILDCLSLPNGNLLIGNSRTVDSPPGIPIGIDCGQDRMFTIDTSGNVLAEWEGEPCESGGVRAMQLTQEGDCIYLTNEIQIDFNASGGFGVAPYAVRRDADFNLIWQLRLADSYSQITTLFDLRPTPDGNYVGTGDFVMPEPYTQLLPGEFYPAACVFKFTPAGELLWRRCDTVTTPPGADSEAHYVSLPLPSDTIITVGGYVVPGGARRGWITKIGPDGCREVVWDTLTPVTFPVVEGGRYAAPEIYPNPAFTQLNVLFAAPPHNLRWELYDSQGKKVLAGYKESLIEGEELTLDITPLKAGVYWLRLADENGFFPARTVVKAGY